MHVGVEGINGGRTNEDGTSNCGESLCDSKFDDPDSMVQIHN